MSKHLSISRTLSLSAYAVVNVFATEQNTFHTRHCSSQVTKVGWSFPKKWLDRREINTKRCNWLALVSWEFGICSRRCTEPVLAQNYSLVAIGILDMVKFWYGKPLRKIPFVQSQRMYPTDPVWLPGRRFFLWLSQRALSFAALLFISLGGRCGTVASIYLHLRIIHNEKYYSINQKVVNL